MSRRRVRTLGRFLLAFVFYVIVAFLLAPVALTVVGSFARAWHRSLFFSGYTLDWYRYVWDNYSRTIALSLKIATLSVVITTLTGVPASYFIARSRTRLMEALEEVLVMPMAIPGLAFAFALIQTHYFWRQQWFFILIGHVVFTLPFLVRTVVATLRGLDLKLLEESAASLGATWLQRFVSIVLPNLRNGIVAGALMVFTVSLGEFNLTFFLYTPINMTLPVGLYEAYASLRLEIGSAYTTIFLVIIIPALLLIQYVGGDIGLQKEAGKV